MNAIIIIIINYIYISNREMLAMHSIFVVSQISSFKLQIKLYVDAK